jgi:hypothetical protein
LTPGEFATARDAFRDDCLTEYQIMSPTLRQFISCSAFAGGLLSFPRLPPRKKLKIVRR